MSKPHPQGPRVFRSFCEADRHPYPSQVAIRPKPPKSPGLLTVALGSTVTIKKLDRKSPFIALESVTMTQTTPTRLDSRPDQTRTIDLTGFASRVAPPTGVLGAGFDLPASFFSRLNAAQPGDLALNHLPELTAKS